MVGLVRCVPVSILFSDLLKSWGEECDGTHMYLRATVEVYTCIYVGARDLYPHVPASSVYT